MVPSTPFKASKAKFCVDSFPVGAPPLYSTRDSAKTNAKIGSVVVIASSKSSKGRFGIPRSPSSKNASWFTPIQSSSREQQGFSSPSISPYHHASKFQVSSPAPSLAMTTSSSTETLETYGGYSSSLTSSPSPNACFHSTLSPSSSAFHPSSSRFSSTASFSSRASTPSSSCTSKPSSYSTRILHKSPIKKSNKTPDDSNRKQRIKTELCMHYVKGNVCPFGMNCTYAHGEEELQKTRLMDLQRAGLIEDVETYRTQPCWTHVATGSCPFGKRCSSIHDPRITGTTTSWLPHTETQGNSISTDINVDGLHQKRTHAILYGTPFGDQFNLDLDDWADLYKLVCNTPGGGGKLMRRRNTNAISELHKLQIALQMRGDAGWMYKYRPQHVVYKTLCMVVQKRAFRLEKSGMAHPIPIAKFNPGSPHHILVRELAFGPDSDPTVRGVALYFDISEGDVTECTPQQAKRYRWKKNIASASEARISIFDTRESFAMIRPFHRDAFDLATQILQHRVETVKAERLTIVSERFEAIKVLYKEKEVLREIFMAHKRSWVTWCWPIATGRHETIDDDTPVPPVDTKYTPIIDADAMVNYHAGAASVDLVESTEAVKGSCIQPLWESFVGQRQAVVQGKIDDDYHDGTTSRSRLSVFTRLGCGESINANRALPHITKRDHSNVQATNILKCRKNNVEAVAISTEGQSERCWKALLLKEEQEHRRCNEWTIVRDHFQNSRCKKVLSILQN